ncbi:helix-turn-helix domain-containing protein [Prevotella sp.]|uniref:helix-turn-helix domain-containing protein n=1 Tax=Prevotella sp. TaxID=59823 RepID=UPI003DA59BF5
MNIDNFHPLILNVGKAVLHADWNWQNVCSPFARIYYIVKGEADVEIDGISHKLIPDRMYLIPPFTTHSTKCKGLFIHYYIHIYDDSITGNTLFEEYDFPFDIKSNHGEENLFERLCNLNPSMILRRSNPIEYDNNQTLARSIIHNKQRSEWLKMESRGIIFQICSRFLVNATTKAVIKNERILKATKLIHTNLAGNITIEKLAAEAGISQEYFIRLFRLTTGTTPMLYINQKRIEKAELLLLTTEKSIREIALTLGYEDNSYFVRVFKRVTNTTPSEYRRQNKQ